MNLIEATIDDDGVSLRGHPIPLDRGRRPPSRNGRSMVGIRPEAFEDAAFAPPGRPKVDVEVEVVEELGSDAHVFFEVDAPPRGRRRGARDEDEEASLMPSDDRALFARASTRARGRGSARTMRSRSTRRASTSSTRRRARA